MSVIRYIAEQDVESVFSADLHFEGNIQTEEPLLLKCTLSGSIESSVDVYISKNAQVNALIKADRVTVHGGVEGDIQALEHVHLFATSRVKGNIQTKDLVVQSGAFFQGSCDMSPTASS